MEKKNELWKGGRGIQHVEWVQKEKERCMAMVARVRDEDVKNIVKRQEHRGKSKVAVRSQARPFRNGKRLRACCMLLLPTRTQAEWIVGGSSATLARTRSKVV